VGTEGPKCKENDPPPLSEGWLGYGPMIILQ